MATRKSTAARKSRTKSKAATKQAKSRARKSITVQDFSWGASFEGTREQLIAAGLLSPKTKMPRRGEVNYTLPLNWDAGYEDAPFSIMLEVPPKWEARLFPTDESKVYDVWVEFNASKDLNVRERAEPILRMIDALRDAVERIAPVPLSVAVPAVLKEAKTYGSPERRAKAAQGARHD